MLAKLLKYDLKYIYKTLGIYYLIIILCALVFLVTGFQNSSGLVEFIHLFAGGASFGMSIGMLINSITRSWMRFQKNFYQEEAYLTHTLPVTKNQLLLSKSIASFTMLLISLILMILCVFATQPGIREWLGELDHGLRATGSSLVEASIILIVVTILQQTFIIQCGYAGIVIGHRQNEHRGLWSWIAGFAIYIIINLLAIGTLLLWSTFDPDIHNFITSGDMNSIATLQTIAIGVGIFYLGAIIVTYIITQKVFERGVDVE